MTTRNKTRILLGALFGLTCTSALADIGLSVNQMNGHLDKCYQQSQLAHQLEDKHKLSSVSCTKVLRNEWLTKEAESNARLNRAIIYMAKGDNKLAIKDFKKLLNKGTHRYQAHVALAQILESENDYMEAIAHYDNAIAIDNSNPLLLKKRTRIAQHIALEKRQRLSMHKSKQHTDKF